MNEKNTPPAAGMREALTKIADGAVRDAAMANARLQDAGAISDKKMSIISTRLYFANEVEKIARAALSAAPDQTAGGAVLDRETIQTILDLLNPLHGSLDEQTYDDKLKGNFDLPGDAEHNVNITSKHDRDLTQAVSILENRLRAATPPGLDPVTVATKPLIVDIGAAFETLKNNPELCAAMTELVAPTAAKELEEAYAEIERHQALLEAIEKIAKQRLTTEIDHDGDRKGADIEGGYDAIIGIAREVAGGEFAIRALASGEK